MYINHSFYFLSQLGSVMFIYCSIKKCCYLANIIHACVRDFTVIMPENVNILILFRLNVTITSIILVFVEQLF